MNILISQLNILNILIVLYSYNSQESVTYFVELLVTNGAELTRSALSRPVLLDVISPTAGDVMNGDKFNVDIAYQHSDTTINGMMFIMCVNRRIIDMTASYPLRTHAVVAASYPLRTHAVVAASYPLRTHAVVWIQHLFIGFMLNIISFQINGASIS